MARQAKSSFRTVLIIVAIVVGYWVFSDDQPSQNTVSSQVQDPDAGLAAPGYGASFDRSWPQLTDDSATALADQLLVSNYYVILDGSGSMEEQRCSGDRTKMDVAKDAMLAFADQIPPAANLGLAVFDGESLSERVALGASNRDQIAQQVRRTQPDGGTPLLASIAMGFEALEAQAKRQLGYGEYHLVVLTDGEANEGQEPGPAVNHILSESPIVIHTIGFCIGDNHSLNQPGYIDYRAANDLDSLRQGLTDVLAEAPDFTVTDFQ